MKPLSPGAIFIFFSRSFSINSINNVEFHQHGLRVSNFSTSSNSFYSSPSSSYPSRRHEEESRNVRVSVWWDFENCTLPVGASVFKVAQSFSATIRANGIKGPIQITAFGDVLQLSKPNQEALSSTGINLAHIPHGGKHSADRSLLVDLMYWVSQNPPPAHLFLISGDRDFASILHRLRMNNYNILLASPETAPGVLCSATSILWHWNALVKGENLTGKYFNQPPDGPHGSWYGHYRVPLEDPFAVTEQPACSQAELSESGSDTKLRPVPKVVVKQIRHILNSYPKGISITELRSELGKRNVSIDKDLYGYKKFSRFLLSMPHILNYQIGDEGQQLIHSIAPKGPEPVESTSVIPIRSIASNGKPDFVVTPKLNAEDSSSAKVVDDGSSLPLSPELNVKEPPTKIQEPQTEVQDPPPLVEKINNTEVTESHLHPREEQTAIPEVLFFKRIWREWFGDKDGGSEKKSCSVTERNSTSLGSTESKNSEENCVKTSQSAHPVGPASFSSSCNEAVMDDKTAGSSEVYNDKSGKGPGFFSQILSWCKFWSSPNSDHPSEQPSTKLNQITIDSGKHEIFLKESLWNDMEAFIDTPSCSVLVLQSRTRKQMAQLLQEQGPSVLKSLSESDLLQLVDLLISEKEWVGECPSQSYPFKLIRPAGKFSSISCPRSSNGLRSIFVSKPLRSSSQRLTEHSGDKSHQNLPHTGISPLINKKTSGKSRDEILADCQKLVNDIVKEYPVGFNMGSFRKLFLERYGYSLDLQKLGYQKLATLLQIMPGVKIESTHIIPSGKYSKGTSPETADPNVQEMNVSVANSDSELSDVSRKDDDLDSPWDELGPVANKSCKRNEIELGLSRKRKQTMGQIHDDYETLSDAISDSEEETSSVTGSEGQAKHRRNEEDSSLLHILDSWYSNEEENNRGDGSQNVDGTVECSQNSLEPSGSSGIGIKTETPEVNYKQKQRPFKSYCFVSDQPGDNKDKLIDGVLGSLKKSSESRIQG